MNLHIKESYKIRRLSDMMDYLIEHKCELGDSRSMESYLIEWRAHNIMYDLGLFRSHTKDVDLNDDESMTRRIAYAIIWLISFSFVEYSRMNREG